MTYELGYRKIYQDILPARDTYVKISYCRYLEQPDGMGRWTAGQNLAVEELPPSCNRRNGVADEENQDDGTYHL